MSLTAIAFLLIFLGCSILSLLKGPFWGILLYIHVYFNMPSHQFWRAEVPDLRWSFMALAILLISSILHRSKLSRTSLFSSWVSRELLFFYFLVLVTGFFSEFPLAASEKMHFFLGYILIYFIILKAVRSFDQLILLMGWIVLEAFQLSRLAHARYHGGRLEGVGLPDAASANLFGGLIIMVLPFFLPFIFSRLKKIKFLAILLVPFVVNAFMMCGSRGAFVGLFSAALLVIYLVYTQKGGVINKKVVFVYLVFAVAGFGLLLSPDYKERLYSLSEQKTEDVSSGRTDIWKHGIKMVRDFPFGAGPGGFMELSPLYIPPELIEKGVGKRAAHNSYLLVLVEQGYLGLLLYLLIILTVYQMFGRCWRLLKTGKNLFESEKNIFQVRVEYVHLALIASFTAFVTSIFFASRVYFEFFYIFLALITVYFELVCAKAE